MPTRNKSNAIKIGPWWIPERLVNHIEAYRKKHNLTKTAVIVEALEGHENTMEALGEAVSVIYLNDSSDYLSSLWEIVELLGGDEAVELLQDNGSAAFHKYYLA